MTNEERIAALETALDNTLVEIAEWQNFCIERRARADATLDQGHLQLLAASALAFAQARNEVGDF